MNQNVILSFPYLKRYSSQESVPKITLFGTNIAQFGADSAIKHKWTNERTNESVPKKCLHYQNKHIRVTIILPLDGAANNYKVRCILRLYPWKFLNMANDKISCNF